MWLRATGNDISSITSSSNPVTVKRVWRRFKPEGLVLVTENQELVRKGMRRFIKRLGFDFFGQDELGRDIWLGKW